MSRDELVHALLALPRGERAEVLREVARSLEPEELSQDEWADAWADELNRRIDEMENGEPGVPFDALLEELGQAGGRKAS